MMVTFTRQRILAASCAGLLVSAAALTWSPAAWGQGALPALQVQESQPRGMDRDLEGKQKGVLTKAKGGTVWIDRTAYPLASDAAIQGTSGRTFRAIELKWDDVDYHVDYWLGTESTDKQIIQMIIYLPE